MELPDKRPTSNGTPTLPEISLNESLKSLEQRHSASQRFKSPDENGPSTAVILKILIAGAGIAGLTAAIALRKEGHEVHLYEQSQLSEEIGAAIHIVPNANGVLRRLGVRHEERGAIKLLQTRYFDSKCNLLSVTQNDAESWRWQVGWLQAHRGHLHAHLKEVATSPEGDGPPAQIHASSRIVNADPQKAEFAFENGERVRGDVVVGADGVRSFCRKAVAGPKYDSFPYGKSAFRFMVPRAKVLEDPETRDLAEALGSLDMFFSPENKVIVYPCVNNTLLNIVCIHPSHLSEASADTYNKSVSKEKVLEVFRDFDPRILKIFEKCDSDTLKVWPLLDALNMPTFVKGRLALIGDSAHPFTPFIGQGGAMAIEDAVALGVMLSRGVTAAEVPDRLELYNKARHERATLIQGYSRVAGGDGVKPGEEKAAKLKGREHALYALNHDEYHASTQILREHLWQQITKAVWLQPTVFGPIPTTLQRYPKSGSTVTTASIKFKTSGTLLRNLFPNKSYAFSAKDTVALASFSIRSYRNVDWLGGHGFHQVSFEIHGVSYTTSTGSTILGRYLPVMIEDSADAIIAGRESFGYPSVFSEIEVENSSANSYHVDLSWNGIKWASIWLKDLQTSNLSSENSKPSSAQDEAIFIHKYIPATNEQPIKSKADADYDILLSNSPTVSNGAEAANGEIVSPMIHSLKSSTSAGFDIFPHNEKQLPTLHHIVSRLGELPIFDVVEAIVQEEEGVREALKATRID